MGSLSPSPDRRREEAMALLHEHRHPDPAFSRGVAILEELARAGDVLASLHLGDLHAQVSVLPDRWRRAAQHYAEASRAGHPAALDRLGDLHLLGRGVPRSARAALECWAETARLGYPVGYMHLAFALEHGLGTEPDRAAAHRARLWALAFGFPYGIFRLALDWERGEACPCRPDLAWAAAGLAADLRYPHGRDLFQSFETTLSPAERKRAEEARRRLAEHHTAWERKILDLERRDPGLLADGNRLHELLASTFAPVARALGIDLAPFVLPPPAEESGRFELGARARHDLPAIEPLDAAGLIVRAAGFATLDECAHVMELVYHELRPARELVAALGEEQSHEHESFDGRSALLDFTRSDVLVHWLGARLEALLGVDGRRVEPFSVLQYGPGNRYRPHVDALDAVRLRQAEARGDRGGQRLTTFLLTLAEAREGGETSYPRLGLVVTGRTGTAVWHRNATAEGRVDERLLHEGRPITAGEKWLLRTAVRAHPLEG